MEIRFKLNNKEVTFNISPFDKLLDVLRDYGLTSVKRGCEEGECGACTVILNNQAVPSCMTFAAKADKGEVLTLEGLGDILNPHPLQKMLAKEGATQCGYCTPGSIMSAYALYINNKGKKLTRDDVITALDGNLCRCTGYLKRIDAILKAYEIMDKQK